MSKTINFRATSKTFFEIQLKPYPAVKTLPKWFTESNPYLDDGFPQDGKSHVRHRYTNHGFKKCVPLLDGMSAGYIVPLWSDVEISNSQEYPSVYWKTKHDVFIQHGDNTRQIQPPFGYSPQVFKYLNCWIPETPKGYSCLIVSPIGHNDPVIKAIPAVVDTDKSSLELLFPVWISSSFNGIVEKGTPLAQIIPFKRDNWESTFDYYENGEYASVVEEKNFASTIVGHYLKNVWSKKKFK